MEHCLHFFYCRYKCEYGPKDFSRIVKPITESLLWKLRKKQVLMETVQEGNTLAPTRKARANRSQGGQGRKPPRTFKPKTGGSIIEPMDWMVADPITVPKKRGPRKKATLATQSEAADDTGPHGCTNVIPDLNEVPMVMDSPPPPAKAVKKRAPRKKKVECNADCGLLPSAKHARNGYGGDTGMPLPPVCDTVIGDCPPEEGPGEVLNPVEIEASFPVRSGTIEGTSGMMKPKIQRDSKKKWGQSIKRGCRAQFTVKTLLYLPHVSEISIIQEKHVNSDGLVVHGGMKLGDRSAFSAHLSPEIRAFVEDCLRRKDTPNQIMRKHLDILKKYRAEGKDITRDLLLTTKDIRNISGKLAQETYMLHKNDAQSVRMWVQRNPEKVFYYSESNQKNPVKVQGELTGKNMPFTIGIQTEWQKQMMLKHGHRGGISVDATFGTNDKKVLSLTYCA